MEGLHFGAFLGKPPNKCGDKFDAMGKFLHIATTCCHISLYRPRSKGSTSCDIFWLCSCIRRICLSLLIDNHLEIAGFYWYQFVLATTFGLLSNHRYKLVRHCCVLLEVGTLQFEGVMWHLFWKWSCIGWSSSRCRIEDEGQIWNFMI